MNRFKSHMNMRNDAEFKFIERTNWMMAELVTIEPTLVEYSGSFSITPRMSLFNEKVKKKLF